MFSRNHIINLTSIIVIAFINSIYMLVFSPKSFLNPAALSISFLFLFVFLIKSIDRFEFLNSNVINKNIFMILLLLISLTMIIALLVLKDILPINRFFSSDTKLLNIPDNTDGIQPYKYILTNNGDYLFFRRLLGITGFLLTGFLIIKKSKTLKLTTLLVFIFIFSPIIYLGILIKGELIFTVSIIIMSIFITEIKRGLDGSLMYFLVSACISGVILFINLVYIIPLIIFSLYFYRSNLIKACSYLMLSFVIFFLLVFVLRNPFTYYSANGNIIWLLLVFSMFAFYLGWSVSNIHEVLFSAGLLTLILLTALTIMDLSHFGYANIFSKTYGFHIVLYCMPVLFLVVSIHEYKVDKFLGKIIRDN